MDRDAAGHFHTLAGEASLQAEQRRRDASRLRDEAVGLDRMADQLERRAAWYNEAAGALSPPDTELPSEDPEESD